MKRFAFAGLALALGLAACEEPREPEAFNTVAISPFMGHPVLGDPAAPVTLVEYASTTCGHCKEVLPKLDSFYRSKWKADGLKIFAVAKETEGTKADWLKFVKDNKLTGWTHVYYSKEADKARTDNGIPGYSQLYDVQSFPTLYLLDKDKRIIAKKLTYQQLDEIIQLKKKGQ